MNRAPRRTPLVLLGLLLSLLGALVPAQPAAAETFVPVSGAGSTWSANAIDQWRRNVNQYGLKVNYASSGSSDGRNQFRNGTVDFGVSEIPYGVKDGNTVDNPPSRPFAYMPIVAGGTAFMYNLSIGGKRVQDLRLSGETVAALFTGGITRWDDPRVKADNPGLALPARRVVPVVRSDGSGTTAQFSAWLAAKHGKAWDSWCALVGRPTPCGTTSNYPVKEGRGFVALAGSLNVSGYVAQDQSEGAITYVEYSYALNLRFPVAKLLNAQGYYVGPTASNVAVGLLRARINEDASSRDYLTQDLRGVYDHTDRRAYPLSSYSYMVVPTATSDSFNTEKGKSLGSFATYFLCQGQQEAEDLGYSPLPVNLVEAGLAQVRRIPGVQSQDVDISRCNNPTFSKSGENTLAKNAPQPRDCDRKGTTQCVGPQARAVAAAGGGTSGGTPVSGGSGGGTGTAGAPRLDGAGTPGTPTATDPLTGAPLPGSAPVVGAPGGEVQGDASGDAGGAVAVPVVTSAASGVGSPAGLVVLACLVLLAACVVPPLLTERLAGRGGAG